MSGIRRRQRDYDLNTLPTAALLAGCSLGLIAFGVLAVSAAAQNWDGSFARPIGAAWFFGAVTAFFAVVGVWGVIEKLTTRLRLSPNRLVAQRFLTRLRCDISEIDRLVWEPGGGIAIRARGTVVTVRPDVLRRRDWRVAALCLHKAVPPSAQVGWRSPSERLADRRRRRAEAAVRRKRRLDSSPARAVVLGALAAAGAIIVPAQFGSFLDLTDDGAFNQLLWSAACGLAGAVAVVAGAAGLLRHQTVPRKALFLLALAFGVFAAVRFWVCVSQGIAAVSPTA